MAKQKILDMLSSRLVVLDGAMGTELQKRGMPAGSCPEHWSLLHPEVLTEIHGRYVEAGSDIIYTCTFGANRSKLTQYGLDDVTGINRELARIACRAAAGKALVAGDIGPTGHFVKPFGSLSFDDAVVVFKDQIRGLLDGGVDLLVIETQMDIQEARAALIAARELTDLFVMVTMTYEDHGRTLNGTDPLSALVTLQSLGADAVGCNCSMGPEGMIDLVRIMKPYATVPIVAKPNAGLPQLQDGRTIFTMDPESFGNFVPSFIEAGVNILGGCCGTTPEHIKAINKTFGSSHSCPIRQPVRSSLSALSSARGTVLLGHDKPFTVIGERINPTGKKDLQQELREGNFSIVRRLAREQSESGAVLLDVNVGAPQVNECQVLEDVIYVLSTATDLPLVIDTADVDAMERALRVYPGRALINSISAEPEKAQRLLPLAARYGAMFILLPLNGASVPRTAAERIEIIEEMLARARQSGFTCDDILVDGLVMTVSSDALAAEETLKTIEWCTRTKGLGTTGGISNVSFGLPERSRLNSAFLAMAISRGLATAIVNPCVMELMAAVRSLDVLTARDPDAGRYIAFSSSHVVSVSTQASSKELTIPERVFAAVLDGDREAIVPALGAALNTGLTPDELVQEYMIPAITRAGDWFDERRYFLPQLIASAETMKRGMELLNPLLSRMTEQVHAAPVILMATVEGDIHDIGKNIVSLMLRNHGFEVVDLGKDVSVGKIIDAIREYRPALVGLSALMTTTMVRMEEVVDAARQTGVPCHFMVGGAVVSKSYASSIGAAYARDGVEAVRTAKQLTGGG
jgi:5-methyltetrahydrofolate--homocysteine methyltransferase